MPKFNIGDTVLWDQCNGFINGLGGSVLVETVITHIRPRPEDGLHPWRPLATHPWRPLATPIITDVGEFDETGSKGHSAWGCIYPLSERPKLERMRGESCERWRRHVARSNLINMLGSLDTDTIERIVQRHKRNT